MAFILNKDKGQRMWGGGSNTFNGGRSGGGGGSGAGGGGGISSAWVDENYVSKDYFNQLFKVKVAVRVVVTDPSTTPETVISDTGFVARQDLLYPNEVPEPTQTTDEETGYVTSTTYAIDSIQVMGGLWTNSYLSALGQNSSGGGGGGGGSSTLQGLLDVNIPATLTQANDGQVLMYNYAQNKWINATIQQSGGTVTSITAGTGLSGGTITGSGTIAIDSTYQIYISHGETAYGWGNHADAGYMTQSAGDNRYLTIDFFRSLFRAYTSGNTEVTPNAGDTSTIDNIKAMFGFWTNAYISALGQNSSGGGGGGSSTLSGLNDVSLGTLNADDVLTYDGTGHWINTSKSSFLSGYVTTSDISDMATKTWVGLQGYLTGITSSMVTTALGFTPMNSTVTFWGQSVSNGVVSGGMTSVGNITFDGSEARRISPNGTALFIGNSDNTNWVYMADMASQSGDSYWKIYASGYAHFKRLYLDTNVYLEYDSTNGGVQLVGAGFYTSSYVSALGANSSGGGGGGSSTLAGLNDVQLGTLSADDVLIYDGTGHWVNTSKSSFLNGYATQTWVQNQGYLTGSDLTGYATQTWVQNQGYLTGSDLTGYATQTWVQNQGYLTGSDLTGYATQTWVQNQGYLTGSDLTGYATQTWVQNQGYITGISSSDVTTALGYTPLSNATTFWGQTASNGVVNGAMTFSTLAMATNYTDVWSDGTNTHPWYGYDHRYENTGVFSTTISDFYGMILRTGQGYLSMQQNGNVGIGTTTPTHNLHVAGGSLRIGDICLIYTSDGLMVQNADGTAANLYATGGVSALGMSAGTSSVDAMTFNYVTINNELRLKNGTYTGSVFVDSNHNLSLSSPSGVIATLGNKLYTEGGGIDTEDGDINAGGGTIITTGNVQATRFYLDGTRYLYVSNGTLYYYNGSTAKQVAFTN